MRNRFLVSAYGEALQYRKRRRRQVEIWWNGSLQTKRARDGESNLSFQKLVRVWTTRPTRQYWLLSPRKRV
jgi:hypothetical protein